MIVLIFGRIGSEFCIAGLLICTYIPLLCDGLGEGDGVVNPRLCMSELEEMLLQFDYFQIHGLMP